MHTAKSYTKLEVIKHYIAEERECEVRTFIELVHPHIKRVEAASLIFF